MRITASADIKTILKNFEEFETYV